MIDSILKTLVLAACVALAAPGAGAATPTAAGPAAAAISSQQQGIHQWQVADGKLILVTGTYQDVTTYKRSLTFYLEAKPGEPWMHVPVVNGDTDQDLTWFSISQGEQTVADAVVVPRAGTVDLVVAETKPGARAAVAVRWYRLAAYSDENPDGPAHYFKKTSSSSYPASARLTVEQVLKKEVASKPQK
ncbi:hypothetical protein [uncultured Massilia sp.]|uniref:hypothetical protein n=1 Tax=uncultured Massilia sp. TaxID=169973 RepID=UPI0025DCB612|nr:hypothetical protein [uncultured Massilia sp.]